ncbi:hypothetical protein EMIHUDRAFT_247557 [Emiliania huxleyi CCMP1516]|uniref:D,D-heptose 1,7-bisphosphate phosphatase n=2 Tax=Emiliania huxleyi TaxID=2903 RepID=A0A0D3ILV8_EMIH1|nr:hypothetical protein EMIHUDRAFT_247557 [Emiliania huxleyi CCMP1516]EOD12243.1 hypothetical protein EMIHUDRAFT_247557 [Emiliania huxleyi CCMP1516]|eukprot:XP_005764672.1 hypothetical protein EMIHUDRAFT_247557 [Emiliania huxleyi CCMP1516]
MQMNCRAAPTPAILLLLLTHAHDTSALRLAVRPKLWLLDRDGCINADVGSPGVVRREDLHLIPGSAGAITRLRLFAPVAVVTNQSARGKGLLSAAGLDEIHERLRHLIASASRGGLASEDGSRWDGLYALHDFTCEPSEAVMVGDSWSDVARRAGCVPVLLATGHGQALAAALRRQGTRLPASLTAAALSEAALVREALCGGPVSVYETLAQAADALLA